MQDLPTLERGLEQLLSSRPSFLPLAKSIQKPKDLAQAAADRAPALSCARTVSAIRDEVLASYDDSKIGHLLSKYSLNRDTQMATLSGIGRDIFLSLIAQGALPAEIATGLEVSYDVFTEFMRLTCTEAEIKDAEKLGADSMVASALGELEKANDRDDVAKARAVMDIKLKIAKSMNSKYIEQKPTASVQVNNYNDNSSTGVPMPFIQIMEPREEDLPPLRPHVAKLESVAVKPEIVDGEYTLFSEDEE